METEEKCPDTLLRQRAKCVKTLKNQGVFACFAQGSEEVIGREELTDHCILPERSGADARWTRTYLSPGFGPFVQYNRNREKNKENTGN